MGWLPLLLATAEAAPNVVLVDEGTLDGTPMVAAAETAFREVAPDHVTELLRVDATDTDALGVLLPLADVLVVLPAADVVLADNLGPAIAAGLEWSRAAEGRPVLVVEPIVPLGDDLEERRAAAALGTATLAEEIGAVAVGASVVPVGSALAASGALDGHGRPTAEGTWLASCLLVGVATGRIPSADPTDGVLAGRCRALALGGDVPGWRAWDRTWDQGVDDDGSRWIGDTWLAPRVALSGSVETVTRDVRIARGEGDVRGRLDVVDGSLVVGGTLALGGWPGAPGGHAQLRVDLGAYVQAARVELGDAEVRLDAGELRAGTLATLSGLAAVHWPDDPCDALLSAAHVEGSIEVDGCVGLGAGGAVDGDLAVRRTGTLRLDGGGGVTVGGDLLVLGTVTLDAVPPAGPVALFRAASVAWDPVDVVGLPAGTRLRVDRAADGAVVWLEAPPTPAPEGPFAPPLMPPGISRPCGCDHRSKPVPGLLLLLAVVTRRRSG